MKPVVVGVDGSECSKAALDFAVEEAALRGAPLRIVCAWDIPEIGYAVSAYPKEFFENLRDEAEAIVVEARAYVAELSPTLTVDTKVVKGHPSPTMIEEAKDAVLVVVGNRGRGGFAGLHLGSVGRHVVHHASCPVVVVRQASG